MTCESLETRMKGGGGGGGLLKNILESSGRVASQGHEKHTKQIFPGLERYNQSLL